MRAGIELYLLWLMGLVRGPDYGRYRRVLERLFDHIFRPLVLMDKNRAADGLALRDGYRIEVGALRDRYLPSQCTMLEMMIGLARACEDRIMGDIAFGDRTHVWFWIMMNKLGLDDFDDPHYDEEEVDFIINRVVERTFSRNGEGGLFGKLNRDEDMRQVEWWYQLNYYLGEYYEF